MKKISDSVELNYFYKKINSLLEEYISKNNIEPRRVYNFFYPKNTKFDKMISTNLKEFLSHHKLDEIENIEQIVEDVIEHLSNLQRDNLVFSFSSYNKKVNESILSISPSNINHEKVLANFYNTSIGHIDIIDEQFHLFEVKDFGQVKKCIIYSSDEFLIIKENLVKKISEEVCSKKISIERLSDLSIDKPIDFLLESILDKQVLLDNIKSKLSNEDYIRFTSIMIPSSVLNVNLTNKITFKEFFDNHYIWEVQIM